MSRETRMLVDVLTEALRDRPQDFRCNEHRLHDKKSGIEYWVANGRWCGGVYMPYQLHFGLWQSARFHRALRKWKANDAIKKTTNPKEP